MSKPKIADRQPAQVKLEAGKKYAWCACGRSQKQPYCDGSHKGTGFKPHVFSAEEDGEAWLCMCKRTGDQPFCDGTHASLDDDEGGDDDDDEEPSSSGDAPPNLKTAKPNPMLNSFIPWPKMG